jgi:putative two-component system response regulator
MAKQKVLVVDDEETIRRGLERMLVKEDLDVTTAADGEEALVAFEKIRPDLVLLDIMMPKLNGLQVCERVKSTPEGRLTPVIIVTSSSAVENRIRGIETGADDFLTKPFERVELTTRVKSLLRIKRYVDELDRAETVLCALARAIEGKDPYTEGHCERLAIACEALAQRLNMSEKDITALSRAGILHDIGKVAVPDALLLKTGPLTETEWVIMREHPVVGERICSGLKSFQRVLPIIRHHHEKGDGSGYPDGLRTAEIPRTARVLQIVDVYDALRTSRPYKEALSQEMTLRIMEEEVEKGWWDPEIFGEFRGLLQEGFQMTDVDVRSAIAS